MTDTELNEAVAVKLGWTPYATHTDACMRMNPPYPCEGLGCDKPKDYCHSIAAAWEVVAFMQKKFDYVEVIGSIEDTEHKWFCGARNGTEWSTWQSADTAPMAICLAFLKLPS